MAASASPKNFHDQVRGMFTTGGPATSTNSVAYMLEENTDLTKTLLDNQTKQNTLSLKLMQEQVKLLKRIAANDNGGSLVGNAVGGVLLNRIYDRIFGSKIGRILGGGINSAISNSLRGISSKIGMALTTTVGGFVSKAFTSVAAVGRAIFSPLAGLKNIVMSSGAMKVISAVGKGLMFIPKLFGKLMWPITAIMGLVDAFSGFSNAEAILGKGNVSITERITSAIGSALNGLLLGIPDWLSSVLGGGNTSKVLDSAVKYVTGGLSSLGKGIGEWFTGGMEFLKGKLKDGAKILAVSSSVVVSKLYASFDGVKNAIWNGLTSLADSIKNAVTGVFTDLWSTVKDWWNGDRSSPPSWKTSGASSVVGRSSVGPSASPTSVGDLPMSPSDVNPGDGNAGGGSWRNSGSSNVTGRSSTPITGNSSNSSSSPVTPTAITTKSVESSSIALPGGVDDYRQASPADVNTVLINRLKTDFNLSTEQAAGIVGNFGHESAGFKAQQEVNPQGGGKGGLGYAQWTGPRRKALEAFAASRGESATSFNTQYAFMKQELQGSESGAISAVQGTSNVRDSTVAFEKSYERAGVKAYDSRTNYAETALRDYNAPVSSTLPTPGQSPIAPTAIGAPVRMVNQNAKRNEDIKPDLKLNMRNAVTQVLGEDYSIEAISGGQSDTSRGRTGSNRHNNGNAGDVVIKGPDGRVINDQQAAAVGQYWLAKQYGSVGLRMAGGGIHLDNKTSDKLDPGQALTWNYDSSNYFPPELRTEVAKGVKGVLPANMRYTDEQMKSLQNQGSITVKNAYPVDTTNPLGRLVSGKDKNPATPTNVDATAARQQMQRDIGPVNPSQPLPSYDSLISKDTLNHQSSPMIDNTPALLTPNDVNSAPNETPAPVPTTNVFDIPITDEYKMMMANGSAIT